MAESLRSSKGQIATFYSYKGGTGRSMALANVAWILASNGNKVLVVDWDLEAPGVHEYFRPFLSEDPDLESTDGLIDMMVSFAGQAIQQKELPEDLAWYEDHGNFLRYAVPLQWKFPAYGKLDFLPAGRQSPAYAARVNRFDWIGFYERLGGQRFMAAFREMAKREYDYVLLDSRTGVSDTAGICTVQLPDCLVVGFTLNRQGIRGAAEVASSVSRAASNASRAIRIIPVPMRLDNAEKQALDDSINEIRVKFRLFLSHLPESKHDEYWRKLSVPYIPFYAYGELLAPLADQPSVGHSLIGPMGAIAEQITSGSVYGMPQLSESERLTARIRYRELLSAAKLSTTKLLREPEVPASTGEQIPEVFVSYSHEDIELVETFVRRLAEKKVRPFIARRNISAGQSWSQEIEGAVQRSSAACVFVGMSDIGPSHKRELLLLLDRATADSGSAQPFRLIPVLLPGARPSELPLGLKAYQWVDIRERSLWSRGIDEIVRAVQWGKSELSADYSALSSVQNPYPGLRPFTELDRPVFFGRDRLVEELVAALVENRFVVLVGPAGSGKSSLIQAGVMPKLGATTASAKRMLPVLFRPSNDPIGNLRHALQSAVYADRPSEPSAFYEEAPMRTSSALRELVESAESDIVIIVDQVEELASLNSDVQLSEFLQLLENLADATNARILFSVRSDFWRSLERIFSIDCPGLSHRLQMFSLGALGRTELMDAIRAPAELAGRAFELGLVERIADEFSGIYSLPLLQQFLSSLWDRASGKVITHSDYQEAGGMSRFAGQAMDRVLSGLTPRTREIAVRVLYRLVQADTSTRLTVPLSEFTPDERDAIEQLTSAGIVAQTQVGDTPFISLLHDSLVRASIIVQT